MAQNAGVPLVPIAITGTRSIAPPGKFPSRNHRVLLRVGKPIMIEKNLPLEKAMASFREQLVALLAGAKPGRVITISCGSYARMMLKHR